MTRMMTDMSIAPTGDVDRDFVAMMIPHHQGAIDMAVAELRYGHNEQLRRLAQEIIVDQQQEIAAMRLAVGEPLPPSAPAPDRAGRRQVEPDAGHGHEVGRPIMRRLPHQLARRGAPGGAAWSGVSLGRAGARPPRPMPDIPVSHHDRVYAAEQFSNTVSVIDPASNTLLGVIRLGDPQPGQLQPALPGPGAGPRHGLLARPPHAGRRRRSAPTR